MSDSNATEPYKGVERLCKLLDAAGVDYDAGVFGVLWGRYVEGGDSLHEFYACAAASEELVNLTLRHVTPEQAVAATLGVGECVKCAEDMGAYADSLCDPLKEQMDKLLRCLENDYGITASWDGLRKVWLTESADAVKHGETRWFELFGTPERAAKTVAGIKCDDGVCEGCSLYGLDCTYDDGLMLELLRGKADKR